MRPLSYWCGVLISAQSRLFRRCYSLGLEKKHASNPVQLAGLSGYPVLISLQCFLTNILRFGNFGSLKDRTLFHLIVLAMVTAAPYLFFHKPDSGQTRIIPSTIKKVLKLLPFPTICSSPFTTVTILTIAQQLVTRIIFPYVNFQFLQLYQCFKSRNPPSYPLLQIQFLLCEENLPHTPHLYSLCVLLTSNNLYSLP